MDEQPMQDTATEDENVPVVEVPLLTAWVLQLRKDVTRYRARQLNMEAVISRWPGLRELLTKLPRDLKAEGRDMAPFDARYWRRGEGGKDGEGDHERERAGVAAVVEWLRKHPGRTASEAARIRGVPRPTLYMSPEYQEYRLTRGDEKSHRNGPTGGVQRAIAYLSEHRPRTVAEVARAASVTPTALRLSSRFQEAWTAYARTAKLSAASRRALKRRARSGA